jgi:hypothetical protein
MWAQAHINSASTSPNKIRFFANDLETVESRNGSASDAESTPGHDVCVVWEVCPNIRRFFFESFLNFRRLYLWKIRKEHFNKRVCRNSLRAILRAKF